MPRAWSIWLQAVKMNHLLLAILEGHDPVGAVVESSEHLCGPFQGFRSFFDCPLGV